jgi:chemotaxis protein methyltransferase CheR
MHMRWAGFRKVRNQVCKRLRRRIRTLQLTGLDEYREYLHRHHEEWRVVDQDCRITISRFFRDKQLWAVLAQRVLPELAARRTGGGNAPHRRPARGAVQCWSIGCAGGEEPYTLSALWEFCIKNDYPQAGIHILATDADPHQIERAQKGNYSLGTLKELPATWREHMFIKCDDRFELRPRLKVPVELAVHDIRTDPLHGRFDLVLCRNLVFTYFDEMLQTRILKNLSAHMQPHGVLVIGAHEALPIGHGFEPHPQNRRILTKT